MPTHGGSRGTGEGEGTDEMAEGTLLIRLYAEGRLRIEGRRVRIREGV